MDLSPSIGNYVQYSIITKNGVLKSVYGNKANEKIVDGYITLTQLQLIHNIIQ